MVTCLQAWFVRSTLRLRGAMSNRSPEQSIIPTPLLPLPPASQWATGCGCSRAPTLRTPTLRTIWRDCGELCLFCLWLPATKRTRAVCQFCGLLLHALGPAASPTCPPSCPLTRNLSQFPRNTGAPCCSGCPSCPSPALGSMSAHPMGWQMRTCRQALARLLVAWWGGRIFSTTRCIEHAESQAWLAHARCMH